MGEMDRLYAAMAEAADALAHLPDGTPVRGRRRDRPHTGVITRSGIATRGVRIRWSNVRRHQYHTIMPHELDTIELKRDGRWVPWKDAR